MNFVDPYFLTMLIRISDMQAQFRLSSCTLLFRAHGTGIVLCSQTGLHSHADAAK